MTTNTSSSIRRYNIRSTRTKKKKRKLEAKTLALEKKAGFKNIFEQDQVSDYCFLVSDDHLCYMDYKTKNGFHACSECNHRNNNIFKITFTFNKNSMFKERIVDFNMCLPDKIHLHQDIRQSIAKVNLRRCALCDKLLYYLSTVHVQSYNQ